MRGSIILTICLLASIILCFVNILIGLACISLFSIFMTVLALRNIKNHKCCSLCKKKLTLINTGAGGRLKDGGQLCLQCISKIDSEIALNTEQYTLSEIKRYEQNKVRRTIFPILNEGEQIEYRISATYYNQHGVLVLTSQRLIFVYNETAKGFRTECILSKTHILHSITYEVFNLRTIGSIKLLKSWESPKIQMKSFSFDCEIACHCIYKEAQKMTDLIQEMTNLTQVKMDNGSTSDDSIKINITINIKSED